MNSVDTSANVAHADAMFGHLIKSNNNLSAIGEIASFWVIVQPARPQRPRIELFEESQHFNDKLGPALGDTAKILNRFIEECDVRERTRLPSVHKVSRSMPMPSARNRATWVVSCSRALEIVSGMAQLLYRFLYILPEGGPRPQGAQGPNADVPITG